jgi:hypothetical protein
LGTIPIMQLNYGDCFKVYNYAQVQGLNKLFVEGDSQIIINLFSRLLNGAYPDRVSPRWCLTSGMIDINSLMQPHFALIPSHVRRKANQIADKLANFGVDQDGSDLSCDPSIHPGSPYGQGMHFSSTQYRQIPGWGVINMKVDTREVGGKLALEGHMPLHCAQETFRSANSFVCTISNHEKKCII